MNISIPNPDSYFDFKERLESCDTFLGQELLPFISPQQAVFDLTSSLALTYSHKMSIGVIEGTGPSFQRISIYFSKLGYNVQVFRRDSSENLAEWAAALKKDTLFVIYECDEVFTGERFATSEVHVEFQEELTRRKIFDVSLSHSAHRYGEIKEVSPFEIRILSGAGLFCTALTGARAKVTPVHTLCHSWSEYTVEEFCRFFEKGCDSRESIRSFEQGQPAGAEMYFTESSERIFDRAVLSWPDVDGFALANEISERLGCPMKEPGKGFQIESPSLCRWKGISDFSWLKRPEGLVVFSQEVIDDQLHSVIESAHSAVLKKQSGR